MIVAYLLFGVSERKKEQRDQGVSDHGLGKDVFDDVAVHISEAELAALELVGQGFVVDSELVKNGGVEVVDMDFFFGDVVGKVIGRAVSDARFDAAACCPERETTRVVVAAVVVAGKFSLAVRSSSEFAAPDDEGVVEEAAHFEVFDEGRGGLIGVLALTAKLFRQREVLVPAHVKELDEADVALGEASGHEAVVSVGSARLDVGSIHIENVLRFVGNVGEFGDRGLHAVSELVAFDAGGDLGVGEFVELLFIEFGEVVEHFAACFSAETFRVREIEDGVAGAHELYSGVLGGEEAGGPEAVVERLAIGTSGAAGDHGDEGGKIFVV